jgi:CRP-like cAMP-binding protein
MGVTLSMFANEADGERFEAGQQIFAAGDPGLVMYVVLEGEVDLHLSPTLVETLGPGEPFGEMALIDRAPRMAKAVARTPCRLISIPEKRFLFLVQQTPYFALQIMKVMADRLRQMDARVASSA